MRYRSWLIVPGDSEKKLGKAMGMGADVAVVDLDETVPYEAKGAARARAADWLAAHRRQILEQSALGRWVRINTFESRLWRDDLIAVMRGAPHGIILPRCAGPDALREVAAELYELEQTNHLAPGSTRLLPMAGDTPRAALAIASYVDAAIPRLAGLTWSAESLAVAIEASRLRDSRGGWADAFRHVRGQIVLAAHACGAMPIETTYDDVEDVKGLRQAAKMARADGFTGMLACHPAQVPEINAAFTPSEEELAEARRIVAAVEDHAEEEMSALDRRRLDEPRVRLARQLLANGENRGSGGSMPIRIMRPA